ncbi:hypothetical protein DSM107007_17330 [Nostoc sp. PCC 7120 = FACHB-418]|nr:hypothetical protein DSM107007_17330 [Nostoc sp. PCC 7120 = FACHB-418]
MQMTIAKYNSKENEKAATVSPLENPNLANNVQKEEIGVSESAQEVKMWRQQLQDIITQMRQVSDWDAVLRITVAKVREKIACDRALIYQFTSPESERF